MTATGKATKKKHPNALFNNPRPFIVQGSFELDGSNDPVNARGNGFTVTRTSAGEYSILFPNPYPQMISCSGSLESATETSARLEFDPYVPSTGVLIARVSQGAAVPSIDAAAYRTEALNGSEQVVATEAGYVVGPILGDAVVMTSVLQSGTPAAGIAGTAVEIVKGSIGSHTFAAPIAGRIIECTVTAGNYTGSLELSGTTAVESDTVEITYDGAGIPTFLFHATDAVTDVTYVQELDPQYQCTVTYTAGVPTIEFAAADAYTNATYMLIPSAGTVSNAYADVDLDGPRLNFTAVFQLKNALAKTWT